MTPLFCSTERSSRSKNWNTRSIRCSVVRQIHRRCRQIKFIVMKNSMQVIDVPVYFSSTACRRSCFAPAHNDMLTRILWCTTSRHANCILYYSTYNIYFIFVRHNSPTRSLARLLLWRSKWNRKFKLSVEVRIHDKYVTVSHSLGIAIHDIWVLFSSV